MNLFKFYRYQNRAVIPAMIQTEQGLIVEANPVEILDIDHPDLATVLREALCATPGKEQPDESGDDGPKSVVLEALNLKKWRDFEHNALLYTVHRTDKAVELHATGRGDDGFWKRDDSKKITLDSIAWPDTVAQALARLMIENKPVADKPVKLLGGPAAAPMALPPPKTDN